MLVPSRGVVEVDEEVAREEVESLGVASLIS